MPTPSRNRWVRYRRSEPIGKRWVIIQKGTGRILSRHATRAKAEASFRAMEWRKHGG